jgi:spermidine synthase
LFCSSIRIALLRIFAATAAILVFSQSAGAGYLGDREPIKTKESLYNNIYIYKHNSYVSLTFGYNNTIYTESTYNTRDPDELPLVYTRYMTAGLIYAQKISSILEIGFGGGRTSWYLHRALPNAAITSVELDPAIVELAHKYFGIRAEKNFTVANMDGRIFLSRSKARFDMIMIDAYRGPFVPFHLLTKEFYQIVADHLNPGGVVVQNVAPDTMLFDSAVMTIHSVFPQVEFYPADGNIVTVAYRGPRRSEADLAQAAAQRQAQFHMRYDLSALLKARQLFPPGTSFVDPHAQILTDDFAPVEALHAIERHNRKWPNTQ